jgi:hypothetical protein
VVQFVHVVAPHCSEQSLSPFLGVAGMYELVCGNFSGMIDEASVQNDGSALPEHCSDCLNGAHALITRACQNRVLFEYVDKNTVGMSAPVQEPAPERPSFFQPLPAGPPSA